MADKCKKGFKKVGNVCVPNKIQKRFGQLADEVYIFRVVLVSAITSFGGWAIFTSLNGIFKLEGVNNWILLIIGIIVLIATYKLGWKKIAN